MIVVDTNIIAYLFVGGEWSDEAEKVFRKDPRWAAPLLWRSEFRSVLVKCLRKEFFKLKDAVSITGQAELLMSGGEYAVASADVLRLAAEAGCSVYDAEFVALARDLGVLFVTLDQQILGNFPDTALAPEQFVGTSFP